MTTQQQQEFLLVKPDDVQLLWYEVKPLIEKALNYDYMGYMTSTDVLRFILIKQQQLWIGLDEDGLFLSLLTEVIRYPRRSVLRVVTLATKTGYSLDSWLHHLDTIEQFATDCGCNSLEAWTRKGLAEKLDWEHQYSVIVKKLKPKAKPQQQQQQRKRRRRK